MTVQDRINIIKAITFDKPDYIPTEFHINPSCWHHYNPDDLKQLIADHPMLFPDFENVTNPALDPWQIASSPYTDPWGCTWQTTDDGITGTVTLHPLENWSNLENFTPPDPDRTDGLEPIDWQQLKQINRHKKDNNVLPAAGLRHGHTFLKLADLRGYQNLIFDMFDDSPNLKKLITMIENFNLSLVNRFIDSDTELIKYPEDLGMQKGPMLSPEHFRKFIKPSYIKIMSPAKKANRLVHFHSDGDIKTLLPDILDCGIDVINLQDLVNGIDWIKENLTGKICVDLDIDRQRITRFGSPADIDDLILRYVRTLGSKQGGLMMIFGLYPGTPLQNVKAIMDAMQKYSTFYSD